VDSVQVAPRAGKVGSLFHRAGRFLVAVREEMDRVTWPSRPELIKATRMIVVFSIVLGIAIGLMDLLLQVVLVDTVARLAR
jgi:preprotein translocase SecE subunit